MTITSSSGWFTGSKRSRPPRRIVRDGPAENEQLRRALATGDVIGQAKGILKQRYTIDATAAFDLLIKLSEDSNTPVTEVARTLIELDHPPGTRHTS